MKKDIGKRKNLSEMCNKINISIWEGIDTSSIDDNGYLIQRSDSNKATSNAKLAKRKLFEYFLKNSKHNYIWLFEDDICFHKKFLDNIPMINYFLENKKPLLLYFGVSNNRQFNKDCGEIINIEQLSTTNETIICSGAYSVIINRNILPQLISYCKNPSLEKYPFDNSCLGKIQIKYPKQCFICNPPLIVPDVTYSNIRKSYDQNIYWNNCKIVPELYIFPNYHFLFVIVDDCLNKIKYFKDLYKLFHPYYKIFFLVNDKIEENEYIEYEYTKNPELTINEILKEKNHDYYLQITVDIKFKYMDGINIINTIENNIKNFDCIEFYRNISTNSYFVVKRYSAIQDNILKINNYDFEIY